MSATSAFEVDRRIANTAAPMDGRWVKHLSRICTQLNLAHELLPSGAGHDAASSSMPGYRPPWFSSETSTARTIRDEAMRMDDFMAATKVLQEALCNPC